jgi:hypothetical protein
MSIEKNRHFHAFLLHPGKESIIQAIQEAENRRMAVLGAKHWRLCLISANQLVVTVHACDPSYMGGPR